MSIKQNFVLGLVLAGAIFLIVGCVPSEVEPVSQEVKIEVLPTSTIVTPIKQATVVPVTPARPTAIETETTNYLPIVMTPPGIMQLTISSTNPRYIENASGERILLVGDAAWSAIVELTNSEIDTYLESRAAAGFNAVLVNLIEHYFSTNAPNNIDDIPPFTGAVFTSPNNAYFTRADYFISKANSLGIYVLLSPIYLGFNSTQGWQSEVSSASIADMQLWGDFVGNRYASYDNIIWVIGGDIDPSPYLSKLDAFVTGLQTHATQLITIHSSRGSIATEYGQSWLTLNNFYSAYIDTPQYAQDAYSYTPTLPFFQIEGYYENEHGMTGQQLRAQAYWSILQGSVGHIFGSCPMWHFGTSNTFGFCDSSVSWTAMLNSDGSVGMGYLSDLFSSIAWDELIPYSAQDFLTNDYILLGGSNYCGDCGAAINSTGTLSVIYIPFTQTITIDMSQFAGEVTARWYDPSDGSYTVVDESPLANSGTHNFSNLVTNSAGDSDWVLLLEVPDLSDSSGDN